MKHPLFDVNLSEATILLRACFGYKVVGLVNISGINSNDWIFLERFDQFGR